MSTVSGDLTCSAIQQIKAAAERHFVEGGQQALQYISRADTVKTILANQTAKMVELENSDKDYTVGLYWINDCESGEGDCVNDCIVGGPELSVGCKTYELNLCNSFGFNVKDKVFRTNLLNKEDVIAKGMLSTEKKLDEWVNRQVITKLDLLAGVNQTPDNGIKTTVDNTTYIPGAYMDASVVAELYEDAVLNNMQNSFLLSGNLLWKSNYLADKNKGNADGSGANELFKEFAKYHDLFALDSTLGGKFMFMVNPNAVFVANKAYYSSTPTEYKGTVGQIRWSKPSSTIPGLVYDWISTLSCANNDITYKFSAYARIGVFGSPLGCDTDNTGIIRYACGAPE
jgi:hypothetical protein